MIHLEQLAEARIQYDMERDLLVVEVPSEGYRFPITGEMVRILHDALGAHLRGERFTPPEPPFDPDRELEAAVRARLEALRWRVDRLDQSAELRALYEQRAGQPIDLETWEAILDNA